MAPQSLRVGTLKGKAWQGWAPLLLGSGIQLLLSEQACGEEGGYTQGLGGGRPFFLLQLHGASVPCPCVGSLADRPLCWVNFLLPVRSVSLVGAIVPSKGLGQTKENVTHHWCPQVS